MSKRIQVCSLKTEYDTNWLSGRLKNYGRLWQIYVNMYLALSILIQINLKQSHLSDI